MMLLFRIRNILALILPFSICHAQSNSADWKVLNDTSVNPKVVLELLYTDTATIRFKLDLKCSKGCTMIVDGIAKRTSGHDVSTNSPPRKYKTREYHYKNDQLEMFMDIPPDLNDGVWFKEFIPVCNDDFACESYIIAHWLYPK
jgi:hypothetical protein